MRLITKTELVKMPVGTLYHEFHKAGNISPMLNCIDDIDTMSIWEVELNGADPLSGAGKESDAAMQEILSGNSTPLSLGAARDVIHDLGERYVIYEKADAEQLLAYLTEAVNKAYK